MTTAKVLLTGATGHIGYRTLIELLKAGYSVQIAIRRPEQEDRIRKAASIELYLQHCEFVMIPDMTAKDAYMNAIQGVQYVIHVASPVPLKSEYEFARKEGKSWADIYYHPAIKGTTEVLRAAASTSSVQRVVITASGNILACVVGEPHTHATDIRRCPTWEEAMAMETAGQAYKASKILAVNATKEFMRSYRSKSTAPFSVVYACPGYVQGSHELCSSIDDFFTTTSGGTLSVAAGKPLAINVMSQVWVEDVARAHVVSLSSKEVHDEDVLVLVGNGGKGWEWSDVAEMLSQMFPKEVANGVLSPARKQKSLSLNFDARGTEAKLGWRFGGPGVWAREVVEQYLALKEVS
jgi:nucleoside-diphosphate-sugar epimerase